MPAIKLKKVTAEYLAEKERESEKNKRNLEDVADEEDEKENVEDGPKPYNFLDVQVLWDKRKRTIPAVEQTLIDWLDSNLEMRKDVYLPLQTLYNYYSEVCQMRGTSVVDIPLFNRYIREKFGKFYGFQENSPYRVLIKEKKVRERTKVQGETMQLKIRDIITEVVNEAGNPRKGLRFPVISKAIISKYPAQRVDMYPKKLKAALERGVGYAHFELVRGVGMCGYYRLPGDPTKEEEEEKKKDKDEKEGDDEKTENGTADTDEGKSEEEGEEQDKGTKRPAKEEGDDESPKKKVKKNVNKKKKKKPVERVYRSEVARHSDPQRVEDAFPLAFTYQSDPKEASGVKIIRYISKYYHKDVNTDRLKKALESGIEKGLWEQTKGNGVQGTYHLLTESFNPGRSDALTDQIAQALVACHEPKLASAGLIKKYITRYHTKLNVENKPHLFKNALERACQKGTLRQLSGIGASGTFQLMELFNPSPAILAGDTSDEEEEEEESDEEGTEYVPRPTKRGRLPLKPKSTPKVQSLQKPKKDQVKAQTNAKPKGKKSKVKEEDSDDEEEQEKTEYKPKPTKSRGRGGKDVKQAAVSKSPKKVPASPTKTASEAKSKPASKKKADKKKSTASTGKKKRSGSSKKYVEPILDDSEEEITPEYTPMSSKSRGGASSVKSVSEPPASSPKKTTKRKLLLEDDEDDDAGTDKYVPKPSKSRGKGEIPVADTPTPKKRKRKH